jgi:hypothetical protein
LSFPSFRDYFFSETFSIREGAMLQGLMSIGGVLIGAWIVSTGWLLAATLLETLNKVRQSNCASQAETPKLQPIS